jgi:hypothetical protein
MSNTQAVMVSAVGQTVRLGKLPVEQDPRTLQLADYLDDQVALAQLPASADWSAKVTSWPMYGNNTLGDCTCAAVGHMEEAWSASAHAAFVPPEQAVLALYWATGKLDNGRSCLAILKYWVNSGFDSGHKLAAFAQIDQQNRQHIEFACWALGGVYIGVKLPKSAQSQQNAWTVTSGPDAAAGSWGGHCVNLVGFSATGPVCVTWGRLMPMSWEFFASYCDEAYALVSPDFLIDGKAAPNGLNLSQLEHDAGTLRGQPAPSESAPAEPF